MRTLHAGLRARAAFVVLLGVLLVAAVGAAVAWAVIPAGDGTITACYQKTTGAMRVIDASTGVCKSTETMLQWNAAGVPGPPGPAGGTVYADNIVEDVPGGTAGITMPQDTWVTLVTLALPDEWSVNGEDPTVVVTESLDAVNESDVQVTFVCNVGDGTSFVWTIDPWRRDSTSFTAFATFGPVQMACRVGQGWGPPGSVWSVRVMRATVSATLAESVVHLGAGT